MGLAVWSLDTGEEKSGQRCRAGGVPIAGRSTAINSNMPRHNAGLGRSYGVPLVHYGTRSLCDGPLL